MTRRAVQLKIFDSPGDHPFASVVREWLWSGGVDVTKIEEESETYVKWGLAAGDNMSLFVILYKDKAGQMFFWIEAAVSRIILSKETAVLRWMGETQYEFYFPFRLALGSESKNAVIVQCRSYCDGFTEEHFKARLETLIPFAAEVQRELKEKFDLPAFYEARPQLVK